MIMRLYEDEKVVGRRGVKPLKDALALLERKEQNKERM